MSEFRVYGPPGTGKTTYLSRQIRRAADKYGAESVLVGSFTRAAAAELISRELPVPESHVGTLHALAYRCLGMEQGQITDAPEGLEAWNERYPHYAIGRRRRREEDESDDLSTGGQGEGDRHYQELQRLRAQMRPQSAYPGSVWAFRETWERWKRETGTVDFTDLIELAIENVRTPGEDIQIAFYDEAQDFTMLELSLVRRWAGAMESVVLAGDDDQTIYWFKGALPDAFLKPEIPKEHKHVLSQSYRLPKAIQALAQAWIRRLTYREAKDYKPRDEDGYVRRGGGGASWQNPAPLLAEIEADLEQGHTVMLLAHAGYMLGPFMKQARAAGLPFHNPYREEEYVYNPLRPARGISSSQRILAYYRAEPDVWGEEARLWTARELYWIAEVLKSEGTLTRGAKAALKAAAETEQGVTHELDWLDILEYFEEEAASGGLVEPSLEWLQERLVPSKRKGMEFPIAIARARGVNALREDPRLVLGTIHSVKGGEADVVYLISDLSPAGLEAWEKGGAAKDAAIRTFYVGMTRARLGLVLVDADGPSVPVRRTLRELTAAVA